VIINALVLISKFDRSILNDIEVIFTIDSLPDTLEKEVFKENIKDCIQCVGVKPYSELFSYYKSATALLFPSVIESFGMPLVEAASFGLPIIAADLAYAHEVLEGYDNVSFVDPYNADQWAALIRKADAYKRSVPMKQNTENSWHKIFDIIKCISLNDS
jgi:glycosyltransferase involved in cell wall biosynthesis